MLHGNISTNWRELKIEFNKNSQEAGAKSKPHPERCWAPITVRCLAFLRISCIKGRLVKPGVNTSYCTNVQMVAYN